MSKCDHDNPVCFDGCPFCREEQLERNLATAQAKVKELEDERNELKGLCCLTQERVAELLNEKKELEEQVKGMRSTRHDSCKIGCSVKDILDSKCRACLDFVNKEER